MWIVEMFSTEIQRSGQNIDAGGQWLGLCYLWHGVRQQRVEGSLTSRSSGVS